MSKVHSNSSTVPGKPTNSLRLRIHKLLLPRLMSGEVAV